MSSAVRSVPESVGGVVSRSCSSWANGALRVLGRRGRRARRRGPRGRAGRRATRPRPARATWCRSRRWRRAVRRAAGRTRGSSARSHGGGVVLARPRGCPRPPGRCRGRSGPRAASCGASFCAGPRRRAPACVRRSRSADRRRTPALPVDPAGHARCARAARRVPQGMRRTTAGVARCHGARRRGPADRCPGPPVGPHPEAGVHQRRGTPARRRPRRDGRLRGLVSAAAAAVRASGRELPERIPLGDAAAADRRHLPAGPPASPRTR